MSSASGSTRPSRPKPPTDPRQIESFLAEALRNPEHPKYCARALIGCVLGLVTKTLVDDRTMARRRGFCNNVVTFLFMDRTAEQLTSLMTLLSTCRCPPSQDGLFVYYHMIGSNFVSGHSPKLTHHTPADIFITLVMGRVSDIMQNRSVVKFAKGRITPYWPTCLSDVIPFGADSLVQSISIWMQILPEPIAINYLKSALAMCGRAVFIAVTKSPIFLDRFIIAFREFLVRLRASPSQRFQIHRTSYIYRMSTLLYKLVVHKPAHNSITNWAKGREVELLRLLSSATTLSLDPTIPVLPPSLSLPVREEIMYPDFVIHIFRVFSNNFAESVVMPSDINPVLSQIDMPEPPDDILETAAAYVIGLRKNRSCFARGCTKSMQDVGTSFCKCSACKTVSYCSRECQTSDWKGAEYPHKMICRHIQTFFEAGGGRSQSSRDEGEKVLAAQFESIAIIAGEDSLAVLADWKDARDAWKESGVSISRAMTKNKKSREQRHRYTLRKFPESSYDNV